MSSIKNYLSLVKFSHTIFAMPFALIGFFLGCLTIEINHKELLIKFVLVIACMVFARSAAMAFNRYLDRHIDAKNPRTAAREIPAGIISEKNAFLFTMINCVLFITATYFINKVCFMLSPVALFVVLFYSYTKRFTSLCHLVLGIGLSLAPIGAYLAVTGVFSFLPIIFSFAVMFWVSGFDIIYALQDEEFDRSHQLNSLPVYFGKKKALKLSEWIHIFSAACIIGAGIMADFGWLYWIGVVFFAGMLFYQHSIVKADDLRRVNIAFMTANGMASVVFAAFVLLDLYIHH